MTTTSQPSTTLFAVPRERFLELKEARHLRRLADALLGAKRPSVIGLDDAHVFPALALEPNAWQALAGRIAELEPINGNRYAATLTDRFAESFSHGKLRPAYWPPRSVLLVLSAFARLLFDIRVEAARARGDERPGEAAADAPDIDHIRLDPPKLVACGLLGSQQVDYQSFVTPQTLERGFEALAERAEDRRAGSSVELRRDLLAILRFFTDAFVGEWDGEDGWDRLAQAVIVRITR